MNTPTYKIYAYIFKDIFHIIVKKLVWHFMGRNLDFSCFKAYDIRGEIGVNFDESMAYNIARSFAEIYQARKVVVGRDIRLSSAKIKDAILKGLTDYGCHAIDLGITGTEEVYFATYKLEADGGFEVTASHNPKHHNGIKIVGKNATPIGKDSGLDQIKKHIQDKSYTPAPKDGKISHESHLTPYIDHLLSYLDIPQIKPLKILTNPGNGAAKHVLDALETKFHELKLPIEFIKINHEYDGTFPNGVPNPMIPKNRAPTTDAIKKYGADIGFAWDGDFDRCFVFDEKGNFIENYYVIGIFTELFCSKQSAAKIVHDPRLFWNTKKILESCKGTAIISKSGHSYFKSVMRKHEAMYGGEISGHHYFKSFMYCDSGIIPTLLMINYLCSITQPLSSVIENLKKDFAISEEINIRVKNFDKVLEDISQHYGNDAINIDRIDGISMEFSHWRFNLRCSNTEPLVRLNIESKGDVNIIDTRLREIMHLIDNSSNHT